MEAILAWLGGAKLFIASVIGGFISLNFFEKEKNPDGSVIPLSQREKWTIVVGGSALGYVGAPVMVALSEVNDKIVPQMELLAGILLAIFGMSLVSQITKLVKSITLDDIRAILPWGKR